MAKNKSSRKPDNDSPKKPNIFPFIILITLIATLLFGFVATKGKILFKSKAMEENARADTTESNNQQKAINEANYLKDLQSSSSMSNEDKEKAFWKAFDIAARNGLTFNPNSGKFEPQSSPNTGPNGPADSGLGSGYVDSNGVFHEYTKTGPEVGGVVPVDKNGGGGSSPADPNSGGPAGPAGNPKD